MPEPSFPIETERLLLRRFEEADLEALHAIHSRDDVARYLLNGPRDEAATRKALDDKIGETRLEDEGSRLTVAATLREDGRLVGELSLWWRCRKHSEGEVGFVFDPNHGGSGFATEAAEAILGFGFDRVGLHRIIGRCDARNERSARLMERLGMRREGRLVENEWIKGEWTDELLYAILDREWSAKAG